MPIKHYIYIKSKKQKMGLFSFIKDAGEKVWDKITGKPSDEQIAANLTAKVSDLGLEIQDLEIFVTDERATVTGLAPDQATKEKVILTVGNTDGIAEVEDHLNVDIPAEEVIEAKFHTVVSGDTLSKISKTYYDDYMKYPLIFEANKPMLSDPDKIYPGQVLRIPELEA